MKSLFVGEPGYTDLQSYVNDMMGLKNAVQFVMNEESGKYEEAASITTTTSPII